MAIENSVEDKWEKTIAELEEHSYQEVIFDMEDLSFVYFFAKDTLDELEVKVCFESKNIYERKMGFEDWWYVDTLDDDIVLV